MRVLDAHPHTLRHSCGFALTERGRDLRHLRLTRPPKCPKPDALHSDDAEPATFALAAAARVMLAASGPRPELPSDAAARRSCPAGRT